MEGAFDPSALWSFVAPHAGRVFTAAVRRGVVRVGDRDVGLATDGLLLAGLVQQYATKLNIGKLAVGL